LLTNTTGAPLVRPVTVQLYEASEELRAALRADPNLIHNLSPSEFEGFVCDRLDAMGLEPKRVGATNQADGGIDIIFWSRKLAPFPFLGAVQVKHRSNPDASEGPGVVRAFAGAIKPHPFQVGVLVTNTCFTPSAEWYARQARGLLRLRGFRDIRRWLMGSIDSEEEWREIPRSIELCPGTTVTIDPRNRLGRPRSRA
jgi:restriction endonuclease Mrr